jgi:hypothetical protein
MKVGAIILGVSIALLCLIATADSGKTGSVDFRSTMDLPESVDRQAGMTLHHMEKLFSTIRDRGQLQSPHALELLQRTSGLKRNEIDQANFHKVGQLNGDVWLMIARHWICIAHLKRQAAACETPRSVYTRGIALGVFQPPADVGKRATGFLVAGIAPDGKHHVTFMVGDQLQRRPIRQNFYGNAADVPIKVLRLTH